MDSPSIPTRIAIGICVLSFCASLWHVSSRTIRRMNWGNKEVATQVATNQPVLSEPETGIEKFGSGSGADKPASHPEKSPRTEAELYIGHWLLHTGMREAFDATIEDYQRLHPETRIYQLPVPIRFYPAWARTQLIGGTAADITGMLALNEELISRYYLPLTPWLDKPNPYNAGTSLEGVAWRDTFFDGLSGMRALTATSGEISGIILQINSLRLYYNREMLIEITGNDTPPKDLSDLKALAAKIDTYNQRSGKKIIPIAGCGPYAGFAFDRVVPSQTQRLALDQSPSRNLRVSTLELAALMLDGVLSYTKTPELRSSLELMRKISLMLTPGFMQLQRDEAIAAYVQQRSLMLIAGSWDYAALIDGVPFETRALPVLGPSTSDPQFGQFTLGQVAEPMGIEGSMGIIRSSRNPEAALDFLHYLTSQRASEKFSQISQRLSAILDTPVPPNLEQIKPQLNGEIPGFAIDFRSFSTGHSDHHFQRYIHKIVGTQSDVEGVATHLDKELPRYLRDDITAHLRHLRRDVQRLDATIALHYTLPSDHQARANWRRHSEVQHLRKFDSLRYRHYASTPSSADSI